ncbi:unnamed protein product [Allacma fusca]|uniref:Uncharacterized protein n=1 Tax=Allacma fusca TaxID=39272 RepID=A0A8J2LGH4_9HEXA|nr:unnamed protein product [Allacma fusca]
MLEEYPFRFLGYDKQGVIVIGIPAGIWEVKPRAQSGNGRELLLHITQILERFARFLKSNYSVETIKPQAVLILDLHHLSIQQSVSKPGE